MGLHTFHCTDISPVLSVSSKMKPSQMSRGSAVTGRLLVLSLIGAGTSQTPPHLPGLPYLQATGEPLVSFCGSDCCTISHAHFFQMIPALDRHSSETATDCSEASTLVKCISVCFFFFFKPLKENPLYGLANFVLKEYLKGTKR